MAARSEAKGGVVSALEWCLVVLACAVALAPLVALLWLLARPEGEE